jgi:hypothetical protein
MVTFGEGAMLRPSQAFGAKPGDFRPQKATYSSLIKSRACSRWLAQRKLPPKLCSREAVDTSKTYNFQ